MDNSGWNRPAFGILPSADGPPRFDGRPRAGAVDVCRLDERPMHNDEAVNGIKFGQLWERRRLRLRPQRTSRPVALLRHPRRQPPDGRAEGLRPLHREPAAAHHRALRRRPDPAAAAGAPMAWAATPPFGRRCFTAVSPAMVFYSRYLHPRGPAGLLHLPGAGGRVALLRAAARLAGPCWREPAWGSCTRPRRRSSSRSPPPRWPWA